MIRIYQLLMVLSASILCGCGSEADTRGGHFLMLQNFGDNYSFSLEVNGEPVYWADGHTLVTFSGYPFQRTNAMRFRFDDGLQQESISARLEFDLLDGTRRVLKSIRLEEALDSGAGRVVEREFVISDTDDLTSRSTMEREAFHWGNEAKERVGAIALEVVGNWANGSFGVHGEERTYDMSPFYNQWVKSEGKSLSVVERIEDLEFIVGESIVLVIPSKKYRLANHPTLLRFGLPQNERGLSVDSIRLQHVDGGRWVLLGLGGEQYVIE